MLNNSRNGTLDDRKSPPARQIRATYTDVAITVYQAYSDEIADKALYAQKFVPPFRFNRMTWIKPSFLWAMYRSAWATKKLQERVLAVDMTRSGFRWCLEHACLSYFDPAIHVSLEMWQDAMNQSPVRVQWDPERSIRLERRNCRSIQIGLSASAVQRYVGDWILRIRDLTPLAREIQALLQSGEECAAATRLPPEVHYPVLARHIGLVH